MFINRDVPSLGRDENLVHDSKGLYGGMWWANDQIEETWILDDKKQFHHHGVL